MKGIGKLPAWAGELVIIAYWWHQGLRHQAPEWVTKHPLWPPNNDRFHKGTAGTASPGVERMWENLTTDLGLNVHSKVPPRHE